MITVDNYSWNPFSLSAELHRQFTRRSLRYVIDHCSIEMFDGDTADFCSANPSLKPSLVFIDANHNYEDARREIDWAISTGCPVIAGHDYIEFYPGVIKAVDETFGDKFSLYGSLWIHQKDPNSTSF